MSVTVLLIILTLSLIDTRYFFYYITDRKQYSVSSYENTRNVTMPTAAEASTHRD